MIKGFLSFIREQGTIGLAVGFLLGGAVSKLVAALVTDIINPILAPVFGAAGNIRTATLYLGPVHILWGDFLASVIDFSIIAAVVYFGIHGLGLDKIDKAKELKEAKEEIKDLKEDVKEVKKSKKSKTK